MVKNIDPQLRYIGDYLKLSKNENFVIPEYQRGYSWNTEQCDKLWQDVEAFIGSSAEDPYFFGTIIVDCSTDNELNLIDGQQRTTTFFLLLKALLIRLNDIISTFSKTSESESLLEGLKERQKNIIDIIYKCDAEERFELLKNWERVDNIKFLENRSINEQYKNELSSILKSKTFNDAEANSIRIPKKQKDNKYTNFFKNFKYFYNKLSDFNESQLNSFAKTFLTKCQIIEIKSWQVEQAITMFNSLNSTGMPLSDADIISAQLYSKADNKLDFNKKWEAIYKLVASLDNRKIVNIDSVLQQNMYIFRSTTKEYMERGYPDVTVPGVRKFYTIIHSELLNRPFELCENFKKIADIWEKIENYPIIKLLLKFNENSKLYLISYLYRFEAAEISIETVTVIAETLIKLFAVMELVDVGYSSSNFKTFLFLENIKMVDEKIDISEIQNDFSIHINKNWKEQDVFDMLDEYDKNILVFLNEYLYAKEKRLKFDFAETVNIEHIMPQSGHNIDTIRQDSGMSQEEFDIYVNKLGNKILLEENINKSISNDWFKTKKQNSVKNKTGYKDSRYNIASALVNYSEDVWDKTDIEIANRKVCKRIVNFIFE